MDCYNPIPWCGNFNKSIFTLFTCSAIFSVSPSTGSRSDVITVRMRCNVKIQLFHTKLFQIVDDLLLISFIRGNSISIWIFTSRRTTRIIPVFSGVDHSEMTVTLQQNGIRCPVQWYILLYCQMPHRYLCVERIVPMQKAAWFWQLFYEYFSRFSPRL